MEESPQLLTVSRLTGMLKETMESNFPRLRLEGEVSNFKVAASGHWYFSLKDSGAVISGVMFRGDNGRVPFEPKDGDQVEVSGAITIYERQGRYQIVCRSMKSAGLGAILARLEELKRRLAAEGLFDADRKVPIPALPRRVGVITSPSGAAIRDILNVLNRRNAGLRVIVIPSAVQGTAAPGELAEQVRRADRLRLADVLILTRGGGSLEDLLAFSSQEVVRAVAACETPIISAVGHEVDNALCDLAADKRSPTPSAAAEEVTANIEELKVRVHALGEMIVHAFVYRYRSAKRIMERFTTRELSLAFRTILQPAYQRLDDASETLIRRISDRLAGYRRTLELARARIEGADPYAILARGYAIVRKRESRELLTDRSAVLGARDITVQMGDGEIAATVEEEDEEL